MPGRSRRSTTDAQGGAAAVELAIVLPLLLVLLFGIVDFGRAYNAEISLTQAAREGARARSLGASAGSTAQRVRDAAGFLSPVTVGAGPACPATPGPGDVARVTATYRFQFVTPVGALAGFATGPRNLTGVGVMRCSG